MTETGSNLTRHSSYTWLRDTCEEEDTCLLATQLRRRYEEVRSRAMERAGTEDSIAEAEQEEEVIINYINFRFRKLYMSLCYGHTKSPPLLHQLSLLTSNNYKTIILAHDATILTP